MKETLGLLTPPLLMAAWLAVAGCSTPDLNPPVPRANTGYVDFYTDANEGLRWRVKRASEPAGEMRTVFSEYKLLPGNILRLAAPAGSHCFEVWFSNQFTTGPQTVRVPVANAKVTPVQVTLTPAGSVSADTKSYEYRPTGRMTRRVTRTVTDQQETFQIGVVAGTPEAYQPKEQMPYWSPGAK